MQNSGTPYQGIENSGVNYPDQLYNNQINACQPSNYQGYPANPPYSAVSHTSQYYGNCLPQQRMTYNHCGNYSATQTQYVANTNPDVYRNHHSSYVGINQNLTTKPVWNENINSDIMQQYNHVPSQPQVLSNTSSINISSSRSPPHVSSVVSSSPSAQNYKHMQSPGHSPHSWSQGQVPSPGVLHSARTTPSPLSANCRSPGHSQPFSPPSLPVIHHSSTALASHTLASSAVCENNQSLSSVKHINNNNSSNPLHSLQKMVMQEGEEAKTDSFHSKSEVVTENCDCTTNILTEQLLNVHQNCSNESKSPSFSTYLNLDNNRFESKPHTEIVESSFTADASITAVTTVSSIVSCNFEQAPVLSDSLNSACTLINSTEEAKLLPFLPEHSQFINQECSMINVSTVKNISDASVTCDESDSACIKHNSADNDPYLHNLPLPSNFSGSSSSNGQSVSELCTNPVNKCSDSSKMEMLMEKECSSNQNEEKCLPSVSKSSVLNTDCKQNDSTVKTEKSSVGNVSLDINPDNQVSDVFTSSMATVSAEKSQRDSSKQNTLNPVTSDLVIENGKILKAVKESSSLEEISKPVIDVPDEVVSEEKGEIPNKIVQIEIDKNVTDEPSIKNSTENHDTDKKQIHETCNKEYENCTTQISELKRKAHENFPPIKYEKTDGETVVSSEFIRNPVKVVIHRIRTDDTNDTWHVPLSNNNISAAADLQSKNLKLVTYKKSNPTKTAKRISKIGPQIIILSPAMSKKKVSITSKDNDNSSMSTSANPGASSNAPSVSESKPAETVEKKAVSSKNVPLQKRNKFQRKCLLVPKDKKRGRPAGAKNKPKPNIKRKKKIVVKNKKHLSQICNEGIISKIRKNKLFGGPYVHVMGSKQNPSSITVVNVPQKEEEKCTPAKKSISGRTVDHQKQLRIGHTSTLSPNYDAFNCDKTWLCAFCQKGSHHHGLGDLYGPYFIKECESTNKLSPLLTVSKQKSVSQNPSRKTRSRKKKLEAPEEHAASSSKKVKQSSKTGISFQTVSTQTSPRASPLLQQQILEDDLQNTALKEVWIHEDCAVWCAGVSLLGSQVQGLDEAIKEATENVCSHCKLIGATLGCWNKGCKELYHFTCAKEKGCLLDIEKFSLFCPRHKGTPGKKISEKQI